MATKIAGPRISEDPKIDIQPGEWPKKNLSKLRANSICV
jgi:hypothetical protein